MPNNTKVFGTEGQITLHDPWISGRDNGPSIGTIEIETSAGVETEEHGDCGILFIYEVTAASASILRGELEGPISWQDSLSNAMTIDKWRHEIAG